MKPPCLHCGKAAGSHQCLTGLCPGRRGIYGPKKYSPKPSTETAK